MEATKDKMIPRAYRKATVISLHFVLKGNTVLWNILARAYEAFVRSLHPPKFPTFKIRQTRDVRCSWILTPLYKALCVHRFFSHFLFLMM